MDFQLGFIQNFQNVGSIKNYPELHAKNEKKLQIFESPFVHLYNFPHQPLPLHHCYQFLISDVKLYTLYTYLRRQHIFV